jgi:RNA polymerase sigma-70 factor (ECF subfamily)
LAEERGRLTPQDLEMALEGETRAVDRLVDGLSPVIQERVARALVRGATRRPNLRTVVEDLTQEIFLELFDDGCRILRSWQPERGLSLESFVAMVAERRVISRLRRKRRNPWTEEPTEIQELDRQAPAPSADETVIGRDRLGRMLRRLRKELAPQGWHLFELLFVEERSVVEIEASTRLSPAAIYAWRSRLRRLARRLRDEDSPGEPAKDEPAKDEEGT